MSDKYYTIEQLQRLLQSPEITERFRKQIEAVLKDGSRAAIESLGTTCAAASTSGADQERQQAPE
ncbi:MAG: hypothetical protein ABII79_11020 [bacterium]